MSERHNPGYLPWDRTGNRLLIQSSLGKTKPTNYEIPSEQFVYGRVTPMDPQQAQNLIYKWKHHENSQNPNINKKKDFVSTNRKAIKSLLHTAHQNYDFRKTNTNYMKVKEGKQDIKIYLPQQNFTYGRPGELEDPVKLVIANEYGETDKAARNTFYTTKAQQQLRKKRGLSCYITNNHNLKKQATFRKMAAFQEARKGRTVYDWKLAKFTKNAKTKIDDKRFMTKKANANEQMENKAQDIINQ